MCTNSYILNILFLACAFIFAFCAHGIILCRGMFLFYYVNIRLYSVPTLLYPVQTLLCGGNLLCSGYFKRGDIQPRHRNFQARL